MELLKINEVKKKISTVSLILMLVMTLMTVFAQSSLGQVGVPQPVKTVGYASVAPTLIGVGQNATVNLWVFPMPTNYLYQPYYKGFDGVTVTFVRPDGTKDTFMPIDGTGQFVAGQTESLGSIYFYYEPNMAGNWSVSFTMPAQNLTDRTGTVLYQACTSMTAYFTVQTDPVYAGLINGYPWSPLPKDDVYWSYPISSNNRDWNQISGDWLQGRTSFYATGTAFSGVTSRLWQPYGSAPNTSHIVWKQPLRAAGIIGGDYGSLSYYLPDYAAGIVMEGKLIRTIPNGQFECIDLASGELLYKASGSITCGIHLPGNPYAQSSLDPSVVLASSMGNYITPYLYGTSGTTWNYYDPFTGALARSIVNASSGFRIVDGTNLAYGTSSGNLTAWDMSKVVNNNWPTGRTWTRPLPTSLTGSAPSMFAISTDVSTIVLTTRNQFFGFSAKDGTSLWNLTLTYPVAANEAISLYGAEDFIVYDYVAATFHCYSIKTGAQLWESDSYGDSPWATTWTVYVSESNDLENLYLALPDGTISALSLATGKEIWRSQAISSTEFPNNAVPYVQGMLLVGGNVYAYAGYSIGYQIDPIPRHAMLVCVNATTGDITWTLNGGVFPEAAANGYVVGTSIYDGNIYCIGKGKTATTVTIRNDVITKGDSALIQGTVMDMSPSAPNTPAVADEDMSEWMDYLNMQNATLLNDPPTPKGVTVRLSVVDPNGNGYEIGTVTSDSSGLYKLKWTPEITGEYTVYATFDGSNSYWGSYATTALSLSEAAEATPTTAPVQAAPDTTFTIIGTGIAIIIALVIAVLILKKKP